MNASSIHQESLQHTVKPIPFKAHKLIGLSDKLLESHYENNYGGAVRRLNAIEQRLRELHWDTASVFDINGIEREKLIAANSTILHEVYFDSIGEEGGENLCPELALEIERYFGNVQQWEIEFTSMARALSGGSGWVTLVWSDRFQRLTNEWANEHTHNLTGGIPILALDMYEHAYHLDYGSNASAYIDAFMKNIHWGRVYQRFLKAIGKEQKATENPHHQISVDELKEMLKQDQQKPLVLDVRHLDDRDRSGVRILDTDWRDSLAVSEWASALPKDTPVVVYCMYGFWVSQDAAAELRNHGHEAYALQGGIAAWKAMGYPSEPAETAEAFEPS